MNGLCLFFQGLTVGFFLPALLIDGSNFGSSDPNETIRQFVDRLALIKYNEDPMSPEARRDRQAREAFFAEQREHERLWNEDLKNTIDQLAAVGDAAIDPIWTRIHEQTDQGQAGYLIERFIQVLEKMNTSRARQILFDIAMDGGELGNLYSQRAAMSYLQIERDKRQIVKLLRESNLRLVRYELLRVIEGFEIDPRLLEKLNPCLLESDFSLRWGALRCLSADPSSELAMEKLRMILQSIQSIEQTRFKFGSVVNAYDRFQHDRVGTFADILLEPALKVLIAVSVPPDTMAKETDDLTGLSRHCAVVARANRSDLSVHDELKGILSDPNLFPRMRLRQLGVQAFSKIGTSADIPWLQQIVELDPYELHLYHASDSFFEWVGQTMVNNTGPRARNLPEEPPTPRSMTMMYPIRKAAQEAIKTIEDKITTPVVINP